jgi:serine/threonine-protein kinase PknG
VAAAYMLEALPALAYLHRRGLLYCDFKPDNLIQTEEQLKIIDLGAVRRIDDETSDIYGTPGYQAPEVREHGPSVSSDLYTVARALAVLTFDFPGFQDESRYAYSFPEASQVSVLSRYPAFRRFLQKGAHRDPASRFSSAAEMAEQLRGVLRQVVATDGAEPPPHFSALFSPDLSSEPDEAEWRDLPVPVPDPSDPATPLLSAMAALAPEQLLTALESVPDSAEAVYQRSRVLLEEGNVEGARAAVSDQIAAHREDWRSAWWLGLATLAAGEGAGAAAAFARVAADLPGELAPVVALGLSNEVAGDLTSARDAYETVVRTDPSYVTAVFGLSRVLAVEGLPHDAVEALQRIPVSSSAYVAAQAGIFSLLVSPTATASNPDDLVAASVALGSVRLDDRRRADMTRSLMLSALRALQEGSAAPDELWLGAVRFDEDSVRAALQDACRAIAQLSPDPAERTRLVDEANSYRRRTLL